MSSSVADSAVDWKDLYLDDPRLQALLGPGAPFEIEEIELDGVPVRTFVNAPRSLVTIFKMGVAHDDRTHIVYGDERLTFRQVRHASLALARELRDTYGVEAGDRVAIAMRNLPEFVVGFWAASVLGGVVVPLNSWWTGPELAYALADSGSKLVIADEERINRLADSDYAGPVIAVRSDPGLHGSVPIDDLTAAQPLDDSELADPDPEDLATVLYTSGTTGFPKGAPNSHRATIVSMMASGFSLAREAVISGRPAPAPAQPCSVTASPLFHIGGVASIVGGPMGGSKMVLMRKWNPEEAIELAEQEGATAMGGVPTMARGLLDSPRLDPSKLDVRTFSIGGAAVPPDLPRRVLERFGDSVQILNGYGSTETTSGVVLNIGSEWASHLDSVGRPTIVADVQVQDADGNPLPAGEVGELCFRSVQNAKGYWNRPDATAASFVDGWFHIGDLGYVDEDGFIYVVDRLKDMVIRGGENVYCAEVEAALFEHPDVADVAIIGLPDELLGERVCAVVVPRDGRQPSLGDLRDFTSAQLAAFKRPEALFLAEELPRNATGKTAKAEIREIVTASAVSITRTY
jgi:acyl-CoA synthetase (AMP-forming)/AMP-acid ligase II